jgi:hypothetical protein
MSIHGLGSMKSTPNIDIKFGEPTESGWAVANPKEVTSLCRHNVMAVYHSYAEQVTTVPATSISMTFATDDYGRATQTEPEIIVHGSEPSSDAASLGELVNTLHDLNSFFESEAPSEAPSLAPPTFDVEAEHRVASILSRSLGRSAGSRAATDIAEDWAVPSTPFIGLFSVTAPEASLDALHQNFMVDSGGEEELEPWGASSDSHDHHMHSSQANGRGYLTDSDEEAPFPHEYQTTPALKIKKSSRIKYHLPRLNGHSNGGRI